MARVGLQDAEKYVPSGGSFLVLKNDKDCARVRFLYNDISELQFDIVHEIEVDGKRRLVDCLKVDGDDVDSCPLCAAGMNPVAKLFIQVFDEDDGIVKIFERGKTFVGTMEGLFQRHDPLVGSIFDLERSGKPNDNKTSYAAHFVDKDDSQIQDFPEPIDLYDKILLAKTYEELEFFVNHGYFEDEEQEQSRPRTVQPRGKERGAAPAGRRAQAGGKARPSDQEQEEEAPAEQEEAPRSASARSAAPRNNPRPRGTTAPARGARPGRNRAF